VAHPLPLDEAIFGAEGAIFLLPVSGRGKRLRKTGVAVVVCHDSKEPVLHVGFYYLGSNLLINSTNLK
jgi:hypothetical protein